jgi:phosphoribosylamine--glycine ligase
VVVKADGLAQGKGAVVCQDPAAAAAAHEDALVRRVFGDAGARVVVEELLDGEELSVFAITDGQRICPLGAAQDHKAVFDGDCGPNTGGMGAYAPPPILDRALEASIEERILRPTVRAMAEEGRPFRGVLFAGLMLTREGPKVLEYNVRFGDPECQVLMVRLDSDLLALCRAAAAGEGLPDRVAWRPGAAVCVVLASGGYPGPYRTGFPVRGLDSLHGQEGITVFHAGTALSEGRVVTAGGRVLSVTARAGDLATATHAAYQAVDALGFEGAHWRRDIARRGLHLLATRRGRPRDGDDGGHAPAA